VEKQAVVLACFDRPEAEKIGTIAIDRFRWLVSAVRGERSNRQGRQRQSVLLRKIHQLPGSGSRAHDYPGCRLQSVHDSAEVTRPGVRPAVLRMRDRDQVMEEIHRPKATF